MSTRSRARPWWRDESEGEALVARNLTAYERHFTATAVHIFGQDLTPQEQAAALERISARLTREMNEAFASMLVHQ